MTAWAISENIKQVIENGFSFDEETGEVLFEPEDLDKLQDALDNKINSICGIIKLERERAERFKRRKQEIEKFQKASEQKEAYLKKYLDSLLHLNGKDAYKTDNYSVFYKNNAVANITDEVKLRKWLEKNDTDNSFLKLPEIKKDELKKFVATHPEVGVEGFEIGHSSSIVIR